MYINNEHRKIVEDRNYIYIGSYDRKEVTIDGRNKNRNKIHIRVKCPYCKKEYDLDIYTFKNGSNCKYCCNKYENSFAYHIQVELNKCLDDYWDWEKNKLNPYFISKGGDKKIWIKCTKTDYHGSYLTTCNKFYRGDRCPYCNPFASHKVHPKDSFGYLYPEKAIYWSKRNKLSPYEVSPKVTKKYWFYCEDCGKEFERYLNNISKRGDSLKCHNCNINSKGEQKIDKYLKEHDIEFISQKKFNGLLGTGGGNLSYDFYLPNNNLLIEFQGIQHEEFIKCFHVNKNGFERQLEHDRRKFNYAKDHNINLLEIWYYDYDKIENILQQTLIN